MEGIIVNRAVANPFREAWKVSKTEGPSTKPHGRVLVVSHFLPLTPLVASESAPIIPSSLSRRSSLADARTVMEAASKGDGKGDEKADETPFSPSQTPLSSYSSSPSFSSFVSWSRKRREDGAESAEEAQGEEGVEEPRSPGSEDGQQPFGFFRERRESEAIFVTKVPGETSAKGYHWRLSRSHNGNIGMFNALDSLHESREKVFIGECETEVPKEVQADVTEELKKNHCIPVFTTTADSHGHYAAFCKNMLWPMFHYIVPNFVKGSSFEDKNWLDYKEVNQKFADVVVENYQEGDLIWIHDYHLLLAPKMIRDKLPNASIGFFLHIPFPSSEIFRCLHVRNELLDGMLGANVVGFQTYSFARHFLHTCSRLKGLETTPSSVQLDNSVVYVGIFPIGIDMDTLNRKRESADVAAYLNAFKKRYEGKKVLIGREKLDYIKGVPHKLLSYEMFLTMYPEYVGKVVMIQVALLSPGNKELQTQVYDIVTRINSKFGSLEYTPVVYLHQNIPFQQYLALLTIADVCIITSLRDGMNLTSHEYVVCQTEKKSPLIISEFAGTYGSLSGAIRVNPWDHREVAVSIHEALSMTDDERKFRHHEMMRSLTSNTAQFWTKSFIEQMEKISTYRPEIPSLNIGDIGNLYRASKRRLILFGYDGTLCSFKRSPELAKPSQHTIDMLTKLASHPENTVCVLTGRSKKVTEEWLGEIPNLYISSDSGCMVRRNGEQWHKLLHDVDLRWKSEVLEVLEYFTERTEGAEIEMKDFSFSWHYRNTEEVFGAWQAKECFNHLTSVVADKYPIIISYGHKAIEIQPIHTNKASAARFLLTSCGELGRLPEGQGQGFDFALAVGADKQDEAVFEHLYSLQKEASDPKISTVAVGNKNLKAQSFFPTVAKLLEFFDTLA